MMKLSTAKAALLIVLDIACITMLNGPGAGGKNSNANLFQLFRPNPEDSENNRRLENDPSEL